MCVITLRDDNLNNSLAPVSRHSQNKFPVF
jgi:hypothetical protein